MQSFNGSDDELLSLGVCGGILNYILTPGCYRHPREWWVSGHIPSPVAPGVPNDVLTNQTGSYYDNGYLSQMLSNQAMLNTQQNLQTMFTDEANATPISWIDQLKAKFPNIEWPDIPNSYLVIGAIALVGGIVVLGDSGPRRYGR